MPRSAKLTALLASLLLTATTARADVKPVVEHISNDAATAAFKFKTVPAPAKDDAATKAKITLVDGTKDDNGGDVDKLTDGKLPAEQDEPAENFFFNAGTPGGRLLIDLGAPVNVKQVNTYSWHPNTRGPQVYKLYAHDGVKDVDPKKAATGDPAKAGWKLIAVVDTRPKDGTDPGGQYGVSIADTAGPLGKYRYLLLDCSKTESDDEFGNTFYSEIDVIEQK